MEIKDIKQNNQKFKFNTFFIVLVVNLCLLFLCGFGSYAQEASLDEILKNPDKFDNSRVEVRGEVIGELLKGDKGFWLNILSAEQSIGVFCFDEKAIEPIKYWGEYGVKGDQVKIQGVFYKNCPLHNVMGLYLDRLEVIAPGEILKDEVPLFKIDLAIILFVICLTMSVIYFIKLKYGKRT